MWLIMHASQYYNIQISKWYQKLLLWYGMDYTTVIIIPQHLGVGHVALQNVSPL